MFDVECLTWFVSFGCLALFICLTSFVCLFDRNPGRAILMCKALWVYLQQQISVSCPRYSSSQQPLSGDTPELAKDTIDNFQKYVMDVTGTFVPLRAPAGARRPVGYWTVKQKSMLAAVPPILKFRPIIAHNRHPRRAILRRIGSTEPAGTRGN